MLLTLVVYNVWFVLSVCSAISAPNVAALMGPTSVTARDYAYKTANHFGIPFLDVDPVAANLDGP